MIHRLQEEAVKIDEVACDMDRRDLPPSVREDLVAGRIAIQEKQNSLAGPVALPHEVLIGLDHPNASDCVFEHSLFRFGKLVVFFEL